MVFGIKLVKPTKKNKCPAKLVKNGKCNVASGIKCHYKPVQCCGKGKKIYTITAVCISGQWFKAKKMVHCVCHDSSLCRRLKAKQKKKCGRKLGCFVVACNKDGSFKQKQCRGSTGYCWCVNAKGKKVGRSKRGSSNLHCKKDVYCKCDTPRKGTLNHNRFTCSNGIKRSCAKNQECYAKGHFRYGLWNKACRKPTKKNKCPAKLVKNGKCNVASGIKCH